jgi:cysteine desulfurase
MYQPESNLGRHRHTVLISIMLANNEVGSIQPIEEIASVARRRGVRLHSDAAQAVGKIPVDVESLGVDLLTIAGHKLYAPQGVGALYVREGIALEPLLHGAGHERGRRAGTENILELAGLGAACCEAMEWVSDDSIRQLRDRFWGMLREQFGDRIQLNGHPTRRIPNTLNVSVEGHTGYDVLSKLPLLAASTGSACHAGMQHLSPVLSAMGLRAERCAGAIRFSLGRETHVDELELVVRWLMDAARSSAH